MLELHNLTKLYDDKAAVDGLTFTVRPGIVTGFLGPNGAGKSTTMRLLLGLEQPTDGSATVNGRRYVDHDAPMREIGAVLDAKAAHPARSARDHLLAMAYTNNLPARRVDDVLDQVGLTDVARSKVGDFSLGMGQRLGIAQALLGDPETLMLDEPANGLDPEGIRWMRDLLKNLAAEGRTVFLSSHLMSEMAVTAEHLIVIGRGRLLADLSISDLMASTTSSVLVRSRQVSELRPLLANTDVKVTTEPDGALDVTGMTGDEIGARAAAAGIALSELAPRRASLEETFMALTSESVEFHGASTAHASTDGKAA
jgi:ABC-2 type transport system ATP-binding protein